MAITKLQPFNLDTTANYTFANITTTNANLGNAATANFFVGNGSLLTGITASAGNSIVNGNSNVTVAANGNVTTSVAGNSNIFIVTGTGVNVSGTLNSTGNANVGNLGATDVLATTLGGSLTTAAQPNITSIGTLSSLSVSGNITSGNANLGNAVSANYFIGNLYGTANSATTAGTVTTAAQPNITSVGTLTALTVGPNSSITLSGTSGFVKANSIQGLDGTAALFPYYGSVGGAVGVRTDLTVGAGGTGNLIANAGSATFGDVTTVKITGGTVGYVLRTDGAGNLTWVAQSGGGGGASISNGTSNVDIAASGGNVTVGVGGTANVMTITTTGANVTGTLDVTGNATVGNLNATTSVIASTLTSNVTTGTAPLTVTSTTRVANLNVAYANVTDTINVTAPGTGTGYLIFANATTGNVAEWTSAGISADLATNALTATTFIGILANGNSNISIPAANGNVTISAAGTSNELVITSTGVNVAGTLQVSGQSNLGPVGNVVITGGTANQFLQTNGSGVLTWAQAISTITDNTSAATTYYPVYATSSSGDLTTAGITTTKLQFVPSTGTLTVTDLNTLSDSTLKENPEHITDPMAVLSQLFGMGFNWADSKKKSYGLMAQMVEKILPELVSTNAQGKKAVNYIPIIAFLVEAVKKQQEDIEALKKR